MVAGVEDFIPATHSWLKNKKPFSLSILDKAQKFIFMKSRPSSKCFFNILSENREAATERRRRVLGAVAQRLAGASAHVCGARPAASHSPRWGNRGRPFLLTPECSGGVFLKLSKVIKKIK